MAAIENVEWLNRNLLRAYPLREDANLTPTLTDGTTAKGLAVPTCLITDFSFTLAFDGVNGTLPSLTGISHAGDGFSLEISLGNAVLTTLTAQISSHTTNQVYPLTGQGDNADCAGWIVLGDLARAADELPEGVYRFPAGQIPFEVSTLRMAPRGIRSLTAIGKYGLKTYAPLYGNVKLIAGTDMAVLNDNTAGANAIWLRAESATGYERTTPCACGGGSTRTVRTINGMNADAVTFVGAQPCVTVTQTSDTVTIADSCSTPCCGCSELNFVDSAVTTINKTLSVLESYAEALRARLDELQANWSVTQAAAAAYPS